MFLFNFQNEDKDFVVDMILEGFRVRMDKLPEKKHPEELIGDGRPLVWGDFHSVEHLIDSSRYALVSLSKTEILITMNALFSDTVAISISLTGMPGK